MQGILSIDQGTTSTRAIVFNKQGDILCISQKEHAQIYPQSGWVEHDAEEIWQNALSVIKAVMKEAGKQQINIISIGITNQRETILCWDKQTGQPLHNALVWQDGRTAEFCQTLNQEHGIEIHRKTGLPLNPYFSASKLKWLLENSKSIQQALSVDNLLCGTMESYLLYRLTAHQAHKSDITNACRTQLFNIHTQQWDEDLLDLFNVPAHILPTVTSNSEYFGETTLFGEPISIHGMIGDQQAAFFGQTCFEAGQMKSTYGTGCFAMMNTGQDAKSSAYGLLTTVGYQLNHQTSYALEGSIFIAGAAIQWLRDSLGLIQQASETEQLAIKSVDQDDVYVLPAFTGLGAPYWQSHVKASISGMTLSTKKEDIVRATLEGICFQTHDLIKAFEADGNLTITSLKVDGGMVANTFLLQRMSDLLNINIHRPHMVETTALGAAYMAGLSCGVYQDLDNIKQNWQLDKTFEPEMPVHKRTTKLDGWAKLIENSCI